MEVTKSFQIYKGAIPESCFKLNGQVRANLTQVYGIEHLDLTITAIAAGESAETQLITFTFFDDHLPFDGDKLSPCNLLSFCCASCGCSQWCREVFGPGESLSEITRHAGYVDRPISATYIFIAIPVSRSGDPYENHVELQILVDGADLFSSPATVVENIARVHRASFATAFADGLIPADSKIDVKITKDGKEVLTSDEPGYVAGHGYESPAAEGLEICIAGDMR